MKSTNNPDNVKISLGLGVILIVVFLILRASGCIDEPAAKGNQQETSQPAARGNQ